MFFIIPSFGLMFEFELFVNTTYPYLVTFMLEITDAGYFKSGGNDFFQFFFWWFCFPLSHPHALAIQCDLLTAQHYFKEL